MEHFDLIDKLEPSEGIHTIPDNAQIKVLAENGVQYEVVGIAYDPAVNTVWLKAEVAE